MGYGRAIMTVASFGADPVATACVLTAKKMTVTGSGERRGEVKMKAGV
jgi:hypothetical protein